MQKGWYFPFSTERNLMAQQTNRNEEKLLHFAFTWNVVDAISIVQSPEFNISSFYRLHKGYLFQTFYLKTVWNVHLNI